MHLNTSSRRAAGALATTALAAMVTITPAQARQDPGDLLTDARPGPTPSVGPNVEPDPLPRIVDDNAIEYLQVALGAVGGMAVVGGLVAAGSARRHGHAHPA